MVQVLQKIPKKNFKIALSRFSRAFWVIFDGFEGSAAYFVSLKMPKLRRIRTPASETPKAQVIPKYTVP